MPERIRAPLRRRLDDYHAAQADRIVELDGHFARGVDRAAFRRRRRRHLIGRAKRLGE